ncbi:spermatogenesis-associated protein 7 [Pyxicephalus adspersus]|uniref:spermatogenesis-associated protein 7 n=1 Tax=Pyxicephalus adspersus TaxID=30357 RepID=UPI003B5A7225
MPVAGGDRRGGGGPESGVPSIPRCGVSSPFRGHMSTKSNAFCIGQSSRLSDQYRIRDHMLAHYNKILTAKAAVDCSAPKSLTKSIKYTDQQRRERLKTVVTRIERDSSRASSSRPNSRESIDSAFQQKDLYDEYANTLRRSPYSDPGVSPTSFMSSPRHFYSSEHAADSRRRHPDHSGASSRMGCGLATRKFQDNREKAYSGDLIEKHSHHFTSKQQPFTPRTLKTPATSALVQSRLYNPPRRKRKEAVREAEVQTDISSFRDRHRAEDQSLFLEEEQVEDQENSFLSEEEVDTDQHQHSISRMSYKELKSPSPIMQKIRSEEEELAYLEFVADVTNEILSLGLFSDRVLDRVFQRHVEENRHHLDEGKMRHLLDILRADLDDEKKPDLFVDPSFSTSRKFTDQFVLPHSIRNGGVGYKDFSLEDFKSKPDPRHLNGKDDEPQLQANVPAGLDEEDNLRPSVSPPCLDRRDLAPNDVQCGQENVKATQQSREGSISLSEDELDTSQQKDHFLSLQNDHEETNSESDDKVQLSEKRSPVDDDLSDDHNGNQRSSSPMGLTDLQVLDHDLKINRESRDLQDLEQSFSEIIQVSKAEDSSVYEDEEKTENFPSDHEDDSDQDDF